jgi:hypothetical protein
VRRPPVAGVLLLRDRLSVVRSLLPERAHEPDIHFAYEAIDVEIVLGGGNATDPAFRRREEEIRRFAAPFLGNGPDSRVQT